MTKSRANLDELKEQYFDLRAHAKDLIESKNEEKYLKISQDFDGYLVARQESLNKWREEELGCAQQHYDSLSVQIDNDSEAQLESIRKRLFDVIFLKYQILSQFLPKPAQYFKKFDTKFLEELNSYETNTVHKIGIDEKPQALLPADEIEKAFSEIDDVPQITLNKKELVIGSTTYKIGENITIYIHEDDSINATITDLSITAVTVRPAGGTEIIISLKMLEAGLVRICQM